MEVPVGTTPLVIVLLSKKLITLLEDSNPFISNLIPQVFSELKPGQKVDVLVAVVDRISFPAHVNSLHSTGVLCRNPEAGSEGVSLWVIDSQRSIPSLWASRDTNANANGKSVQEFNALDFKFQHPNSKRLLDSGLDFLPLEKSRTLRMGLANTIFENGRSTTCFAQQWIVSNGVASEFHSTLSQNRDLQNCTIHLPPTPRLNFLTHFASTWQLTPPKMVSETKGNIVRTLRTSVTSNEVEPASRALERSIAKWHSSGSASSLYEIWGKIINREWWPGAGLEFASLSAAKMFLARYVKVTSGGGGYNARQGLLSLDPEPVFPEEAEVVFDPLMRSQEPISEDEHIFGSVVRPGDVIQFLAVPHTELHTTDNSLSYGDRLANVDGMCICEGGVSVGFCNHARSSIITDVERSDQTANGLRCLILQHFGASSESGIWLKQDIAGKPGQAHLGALPTGSWSKTKLPPHSSFGFSSTKAESLRFFNWPYTDSQIEVPIIRRTDERPGK